MDKKIVTRDNMEAVRSNMVSVDQRDALEAGCETWAIYYRPGSQRGQMTVWSSGRGAVAWGADSVWGDWDTNRRVLVLDESGIEVDEYGIEDR